MTLQLEVGKTYTNGKSEKIFIIFYSEEVSKNDDYAYQGIAANTKTFRWYNSAGKHDTPDPTGIHELDLISEITENQTMNAKHLNMVSISNSEILPTNADIKEHPHLYIPENVLSKTKSVSIYQNSKGGISVFLENKE